MLNTLTQLKRAAGSVVEPYRCGGLYEFLYQRGLRPCSDKTDPVRHLARELRRMARDCNLAATRLERGRHDHQG